MRHRPGSGQLLHHIPPSSAALQGEFSVPVRAMLAQPLPQSQAGSRTDLTRANFSGYGVHVVECQLLPMHVEAAYDRHLDLLELLKNFRRN